ncbi:hypothetical protein K439DRAFT_1663795 [Ramaria rubella]|nr:hypothetical protein K439DRAFT_1663795 [Ramaria rubella]
MTEIYPPVDTTAGFFQFIPPKTMDELQAFCETIIAFRSAALEDPIHPPHSLLIKNSRDYEHIIQTPFKRQVPHAMLNSLLGRPQDLRVGFGHNSQVWKGLISSVKVCTSGGPALADFVPIEGYAHIPDWRPGAYTAGREAWAFDRMKDLQGRSVPWSYGFYKFRLPNGESAFGHIMELVDGLLVTSPQAKASSLALDHTAIWNLADELGRALHDIHSCGVVHSDVEPQNVLLVLGDDREKGPGTFIQPVFLDFGFCLDYKFTSLRLISKDAEGIRLVLEEMGVPASVYDAWYRERMNDPPYWRTMFTWLDG